jgi:hypothetical protein
MIRVGWKGLPKRSAWGQASVSNGADLTPAKLNRILTAVADWVHLGEILVIERIGEASLCRNRLGGRFRGRLPSGKGADISPATPNHRSLPQGQHHGHRTHFLDHQAGRDRA